MDQSFKNTKIKNGRLGRIKCKTFGRWETSDHGREGESSQRKGQLL